MRKFDPKLIQPLEEEADKLTDKLKASPHTALILGAVAALALIILGLAVL